MWSSLYEDKTPRYEKQLQNVQYLVLDTIHKKGVGYVDLKDLEKILEALYEWRIID